MKQTLRLSPQPSVLEQAVVVRDSILNPRQAQMSMPLRLHAIGILDHSPVASLKQLPGNQDGLPSKSKALPLGIRDIWIIAHSPRC